MTRYHYIKKLMYLQYRLAMLPTAINRHYCTSYAKWDSMVPYPPFANGAQTYQEAWDGIFESIRESVEGLEKAKEIHEQEKKLPKERGEAR